MLAFRLEMTFSTSIGATGVTKKLLHCEVVKNSAKDLFPGYIVLANIGPIEEKYVNFKSICRLQSPDSFKKKRLFTFNLTVEEFLKILAHISFKSN